MRAAVLAGRFFGERHATAAGDLAAFLAASPATALALWFGDDPLPRDPQRLAALLDRDISAIDAMLGVQLDAILHHQRLTRMEGSWRGLLWLATRIELGRSVKLRVLHASWPELCRDLERASDFDQSNLFRRIYEDEFGMAGGEPYGMLVMDYEIRHRTTSGAPTDDIAALASLSTIAAAAFSPMVFGASPILFGVDRMEELSGIPDPAAIFSGENHRRFRNLGSREDMRFIGIALPRLRARPGWDGCRSAGFGFPYVEQIDSGEDIVWFAAGFAIAFATGRAVAEHGWPADMRGYTQDWRGSGLIDTGIVTRFSTDPEDGLPRFETELALTDAQERALVDAGLMSLLALGFGGESLLDAAPSLQVPRRFTGPSAEGTANARLSAQFNTIICVSRFAHYVKVMGRDMTGAFHTAAEIEAHLADWLRRYTNGNRDAGPETRARYPLLDASVAVREIPGKPGTFGCTIHLLPQYQLNNVTAAFRLVTEIAGPG